MKSQILKYLLTFLLGFICCLSALPQKKTFVTVKAGDNIMDVLPTPDIFFYPDFTTGKVVLRYGPGAEVKLNYSRLVDEMHFINEKGDTLAVDNEDNIKYIVTGKDTFCYDRGYLRLVTSGSFAKLAVRDVWVISDTRQVGAYNSTNTSVSMLAYKSIVEGGSLYNLTVNEDIILRRAEKYYFGDNFNNFVIATKTNLLLLFPKEQQRISMYLKENRINFNNKQDLEKTIQFVNQVIQN
jgi:hypothetical protein